MSAADVDADLAQLAVEEQSPPAAAVRASDPVSDGEQEQPRAPVETERLPPCLGANCNKLVPRYEGKPSHKRRVCYCDSCWKPRGRKPQVKPVEPALPGML